MHRLALLAGQLTAVVALAACSTGYEDLPLPGSGVGGDTYEVTAVFDQARCSLRQFEYSAGTPG